MLPSDVNETFLGTWRTGFRTWESKYGSSCSFTVWNIRRFTVSSSE